MSQNDNCQYKVMDRVYYVNFEELVKKIKSGGVLRHDPVKIGNAVWTDAQNIPEFEKIFEENDFKHKLPEGTDFKNILTNFQVTETNYKALHEIENVFEKVCSIHKDKLPYYTCTICESLFCRDCPASGSENSRICPYCGGNCALYMGRIWKLESKKTEAEYELEQEQAVEKAVDFEIVYTKLTLRDFTNALIYPFRRPFGLLIGGILFSVLVLGQIVTLFQSGGMLFATLGITGVIMVLKFGILSKCFENLTQKELQNSSYMPHVRKFAFFEDYISPFFTGINSYLVSFGLFIVLASAAGFYAWFGFSDNIEKMEAEMLQKGQQVNSVINRDERDSAIHTARESELRSLIGKSRLSQMESVFGSNHLADNKQLEKLIGSVMRLTIWFQMPIFFAFILGVLFFPAICLSTGENRFQSLKKRFFSGIEMMKTIGFDYVKILFMCLLLVMFSGAAIYALSLLFSKLEMPVAGIFSAIVAGSFLIFYFWVAFSNILSTTLLNKETVFEQAPGKLAN